MTLTNLHEALIHITVLEINLKCKARHQNIQSTYVYLSQKAMITL